MPSHKCGVSIAKINGRTFRNALMSRQIEHAPFPINEWVEICPSCDFDLLKSKNGIPLPFLASDGVMRTTDDFSCLNKTTTTLDFSRFLFSNSALTSAFSLFEEDDITTKNVEQAGKVFIEEPSSAEALKFSEAVCEWGRGQRVWANLRRHNGDEKLAIQLYEWLNNAIHCKDIEQAISDGLTIKGLATSFASKHLRMLNPEKFPVLDEVLSEGLGFALNPKGYALFQHMLEIFRLENEKQKTIAQLEGALFILVRQHVRSQR